MHYKYVFKYFIILLYPIFNKLNEKGGQIKKTLE